MSDLADLFARLYTEHREAIAAALRLLDDDGLDLVLEEFGRLNIAGLEPYEARAIRPLVLPLAKLEQERRASIAISAAS